MDWCAAGVGICLDIASSQRAGDKCVHTGNGCMMCGQAIAALYNGLYHGKHAMDQQSSYVSQAWSSAKMLTERATVYIYIYIARLRKANATDQEISRRPTRLDVFKSLRESFDANLRGA